MEMVTNYLADTTCMQIWDGAEWRTIMLGGGGSPNLISDEDSSFEGGTIGGWYTDTPSVPLAVQGNSDSATADISSLWANIGAVSGLRAVGLGLLVTGLAQNTRYRFSGAYNLWVASSVVEAGAPTIGIRVDQWQDANGNWTGNTQDMGWSEFAVRGWRQFSVVLTSPPNTAQAQWWLDFGWSTWDASMGINIDDLAVRVAD